ncbi:MAG: T9SS type A sorting domain-containing protein [Flavobacteriales bacterium]|nr:T9SS type A sorting domain-containing protein [Flavobacteriales bacterium]MCB9193193.1 T9SS type A sorting domain-containing protein [Flavobacteriales bacterium]
MRPIYLACLAICQTPYIPIIGQTSFQGLFGGSGREVGSSVVQTSDGGYVLAGSTTSTGAGEADVLLIRTDLNGDTLWTRTYGSPGPEFASALRRTSDDGLIIAGFTDTANAGANLAFLMRTDANGDLLWTKTYGFGSVSAATSVEGTSDGGLIMVGYAGGSGFGPWMFVVKTDAVGDTLWTRRYQHLGGSIVATYASSVQEMPGGGYVVLGDANDLTVCYVILAENGANLSSGTFSGVQNYGNDLNVLALANGGYVVVGTTASPGPNALDIFMIRLDSQLQQVWTRTYFGTNSEYGKDVRQTTDGGFVIVGVTHSFNSFGNDHGDAYLVCTDSTGNLLWSKSYGSIQYDEGRCILQTQDGGFMICGMQDLTGMNDMKLYMVKVDANGSSSCNQADPATVTSAIASQRTWLSTNSFMGCNIGSPQFTFGRGIPFSDPCTNGIEEDPSFPDVLIQGTCIRDEIWMTGTDQGDLIMLYDLTGRLLRTYKAEAEKTMIPSKGLAPGQFIVVYSDGQKKYTFKLTML